MRHGHLFFRCALLGSAVAIASLTPALGASGRSVEMKRMLAIQGHQPHAARVHGGGLSVADGTYTVLHQFAGGANDGAGSGANVTIDDEGNIYGTTDFGGAKDDGTVFKLATNGNVTVLHSFSGSDGEGPDGGVIVTKKGVVIGTAGGGGTSGNGVIFQITKKGKFKVLHNFSSNDGSFIRGDLVGDKDGNLYGTALFGGVNGDGTVFKYAADGTFSVLHAFNGDDGEFPEHGVVLDRAGNLYGVTAFGGDSDNGTVFKIASDGTFSTLHSFAGSDDGSFLYGGLDIDSDGNLYGSTTEGGTGDSGTVFKMAPNGNVTTLYNFTGGADGGSPQGDMLRMGKNLYSVADEGGDPGCLCGVVYEITAKGKAKVLHSFAGGADGGGYSAGLVANNGAFYGTTASFGTHSDGVVFKVTKKK
ncbi:MAG TPA: choice-of-anchor tandem repeat GloVer-containing protein [Rhizomicrobium sp.]|nr:choice-of-anchor tandem repeat GloVer-containing protein [Rhizomicrobium sp.]